VLDDLLDGLVGVGRLAADGERDDEENDEQNTGQRQEPIPLHVILLGRNERTAAPGTPTVPERNRTSGLLSRATSARKSRALRAFDW
jgi:hypothetical protein